MRLERRFRGLQDANGWLGILELRGGGDSYLDHGLAGMFPCVFLLLMTDYQTRDSSKERETYYKTRAVNPKSSLERIEKRGRGKNVK